MLNFLVYKYTFPNRKIYIGITHRSLSKRKSSGYKKQFVFNAILKYGWDNIKHEILYSGLTKEEACQKEIELIAEYRSNDRRFGYNLNRGGGFHT